MRTRTRRRRAIGRARPSRSIRRRFREIFADGFSFPSGLLERKQIDELRQAMRELADDDAYWSRAEEMANLHARLNELREAMRK